jgi:hypothetical protein
VGEEIRVSVEPDLLAQQVRQRIADLAQRGGVACSTIFVWGDARATEGARPVSLAVAGVPGNLSGWLVCEEDMPALLTAQRSNPRLATAHAGGADLSWSAGQLWLTRRWSSGAAPLGDLSRPPDVLQKGELLAVVFKVTDSAGASAPRADVLLPALSHVPQFFLLGMWNVGRP